MIEAETRVPAPAPAAEVRHPIWCGHNADALSGICHTGVELALWRRGMGSGTSDSPLNLTALHAWLAILPEAQLTICHLDLQPAQAVPRLHAACDASGTPVGDMREAFVADISALVERFAVTVGSSSVNLRLAAINNDACMRWHRDCVPLRLITTYRGPATEWLRPEQAAAAIAKPDLQVADSEQMAPFDVALFKGCGWTRSAYETGIVHRSPRIAGTGLTRLLLVLNPPHHFHWEQRP